MAPSNTLITAQCGSLVQQVERTASYKPAADEASTCSSANLMTLNCGKTKELRVCFARKPPEVSPIVIDSRKIEVVSSATLLGVVFLDNLKWQAHVDHITSKAAQRLYFLSLLKREQQWIPKALCVCVCCPGAPRGGIRMPGLACWTHQGPAKTTGKHSAQGSGHCVPGHHLQASMWSGGASNSRRTQRECLQNVFSSHTESQPQVASPAACCQGEGA